MAHLKKCTGLVGLAATVSLLILTTGAARRWKARGWVGSSGPVSNEQLWYSLCCGPDCPDRVIQWVEVPSHVSIAGNEQAVSLSNHGRLAKLLYPAADTPNGRAARFFTTPQSQPRLQNISQGAIFPCKAVQWPKMLLSILMGTMQGPSGPTNPATSRGSDTALGGVGPRLNVYATKGFGHVVYFVT